MFKGIGFIKKLISAKRPEIVNKTVRLEEFSVPKSLYSPVNNDIRISKILILIVNLLAGNGRLSVDLFDLRGCRTRGVNESAELSG